MKKTIAPQAGPTLRYSPRPHSAYQRYWHEKQVWIGVGQLPCIVESPALWNLLWLSTADVDQVLNEDLTAPNVPIWISAIEPCQETIVQKLGDVSIAALLQTLPPLKFVAKVLEHGPEELAIYKASGENWIKTIKKRAKLYGADRPAMEALIPHNIKMARRRSGSTFDLAQWLNAIAGAQLKAK